MELKSISASAIKTFETCPKKFYTEYVLKQKPPTHPAASLGTCLHSMFERSCKAVFDGLEEGKQNPFFWRDECIKEFSVLPEYHQSLDELTQKCIDWGYMTTLDIAKGFEISAQFNLPCGIEVHGYIDRLNIDRDWKADIIDLKTQKDMFNPVGLEDNWQAVIYFLATINDNPLIQGDVRVSFWVLRHKIQDVLIKQSSFDKLLNRVNEKTVEILNHDGKECKPSGLCRFCCADCIHKKGNIRDFGSRDISQSAREMKDLLKKIREQTKE